MTPERLEQIRKAWEPHRGHVDWTNRRSFALHVPIAGSDEAERVRLTADDIGYRHQGETWEWWNIICEGHIIDAERFESRHERFAKANVF
ncbi:MAG: hypothetical protein E5V51_00315 [Mesorhizobium sp.]|nr:hypothetical protein EOA35_09375 [Mesorhizobium sp. M8A.F.Ca.ET.023.01.1.1]TIW90648.1 MAG: hypothetical protein E5V51_00315 [Mesorhizobium sp.]